MLPPLPRVHHLKLLRKAHFGRGLPPPPVILSGVDASRSETSTQSKDLLYLAVPPAPPSLRHYFTSTVAPASANFFLMVSASSLLTPSLIVLGAPSTRSLASFRPRLVTSRTALITLILLAPTAVKTTANSVFSSAGAAPAAAPPPATITGAAAAADTPSRSSSFLTKAAASSSDRPTIRSSNCCTAAIV